MTGSGVSKSESIGNSMLNVLKGKPDALGRAAAYTLEDYKVERRYCVLKLKAPRVDLYQYDTSKLPNK